MSIGPPILGIQLFHNLTFWKTKVKIITKGHIVGSTFYQLTSLLFHVNQPLPFLRCIFKIQGQSHRWGQSSKSQSVSYFLLTYIPFIPCLLLLISMFWHRQAIFESKGDRLSSSAECRIRTQGLRHLFASRLNACWQTDWAIKDQANKTWTRQPVPMISKHSAHSTSLPVGFLTWLWRYTCLLLLISMLWHPHSRSYLKVTYWVQHSIN